MAVELEQTKEELELKLVNALEKQERSEESVELIKTAYRFAFEKHIKQKRQSGEPYIVHPVDVALTLIQLQCDDATVCAALMHDLLEDTKTSNEELEDKFGKVIAELVDGVTKLGKLNFKSSEEEQANNFRKMLMAIAKDMRVVLVKVADRLNNMQTLQYLEVEKRKRIAQETLDIFAPLANRFGLNAIKSELEDLCLKHLEEDEFKRIKELVASKKDERESQLESLKTTIIETLDRNHIPAEIQGRAKHFYSIYRKLKKQKNSKVAITSEDEAPLYDLLGIRILVNSVRECYAALGVVHDIFRPIPGRFKDYIAMPKSNMYQSLHTSVIIPWTKKPIEIQIRSHKMHEVAENGIAAHWHYKEAGASEDAQKEDIEQLAWIRQLISWNTDLDDAQEYFNTVREDIFSQEVYALTPKGDVVPLPAGSTPVDFAFKIHTKVGDNCSGAVINDKIVPLSYQLKNGDIVDIITNKNAHPNLTWLNFVKTNQAKHKIKAWFKRQNRERHIEMGNQLLETEFGKEGHEQFLHSKEFLEAAQKLNYKTAEDLLAGLGSGDNTIAQVKGRLRGTKYEIKEETSQKFDPTKLKPRKTSSEEEGDNGIPDLDGLLYHVAKCCSPIPGEHVMGIVSKGKGITIHRSDCQNLKQVEAGRIMEVNWRDKSRKTYPASICIEVVDRVGIVKDILTLIANEGVNVQDFKIKDRPTDTTALLQTTMHVSGVQQLKKIHTLINNMSDVLRIERGI